jgi:2-dehydropantoate 2-reductase
MGAGALGSLLGGLLARGGYEVHLVGREDHASAVAGGGLRIDGEIEATARPSASTTPRDADVTLVTVKSFDTADAAEAIQDHQDVAISLQNGMGNEATLAAALDCTVLAGTATYGARLEEPGRVRCTGLGELAVGAPRGGPSGAADRFVDAVGGAVDARSTEAMPRELWRKLAVNAGINPVTALTGLRNGEAAVRAGDVMRAAAVEVAAVAADEDVDAGTPEELADEAIRVARATGENRSSMLEDVEAGRRTEIDAINGHVVTVADGTVPTNRALAGLVRAVSMDDGSDAGGGGPDGGLRGGADTGGGAA